MLLLFLFFSGGGGGQFDYRYHPSGTIMCYRVGLSKKYARLLAGGLGDLTS